MALSPDDVRDGVMYVDEDMDPQVGNLVVPEPAVVLDTVMYDSSSSVAGTYAAVLESQVLVGINFGPNGTLSGDVMPADFDAAAFRAALGLAEANLDAQLQAARY